MYRRETENKFRALEILISEFCDERNIEIEFGDDGEVVFTDAETDEFITDFDLLMGECD